MSRIRSKAYLYNSHPIMEATEEVSAAASGPTPSPQPVGSPRIQQTIIPMRFGPAVSVSTSTDLRQVQRSTTAQEVSTNSVPTLPATSLGEQVAETSPAGYLTEKPADVWPASEMGIFDGDGDERTSIDTTTEAASYWPSPQTDTTSLPALGKKERNSPPSTIRGDALISTRTPSPYANTGTHGAQQASPSSPVGSYATPVGSPTQHKTSDDSFMNGDTMTTPTMRNTSPIPGIPTVPLGDISSSRASVAGSVDPPSFSGLEPDGNTQQNIMHESTSLSAESIYAKQRRSLLSILNRLHSTGVQQDIDLPQIVVIGSQSVGKSSLIESMSGVSLPRDTGTCTRCPLECRLEYSADRWSCHISLRLERDVSGIPLAKVKEHHFGPILTDKSAVEATLRRAQRAILRPTLDHNLFLRDEDLHIKEPPALSFSHNCVTMRITGPDVPDLYFYDLPGIIANVRDGGDVKDIELVRSLAKNYISKPSCLVLLTVSCETDFENQGAGLLALEIDPEGRRIVGVLTKPDRIENATGEKWAAVLRNEENRLQNGWFCVKQPNPTELKQKISWEEARSREDMFFTHQEPWKFLSDRHRRRLGSYNLIRYLSRSLSNLVALRLPDVEKELSIALDDVNKRLKQLPAPNFEDPSSELLRLIFEFTADVSRNVKGATRFDEPTPGLIPDIRVTQKSLRSSVIHTAPRFCPWARVDTPPTSPNSTFTGSEMTEVFSGPLEWVAEPYFLSQEEQAPFMSRSGKILYLDEVMERAENAITRELPGNYPFSVKEDLIRMCLKGWSTPMVHYFDTVDGLMKERMKKLVDVHFGKYVHSGLHAKVISIVREQLQKHHESTMQRLNAILSVEDLPFTLNHMYLKEYKSRFYAHFRDIRRRSKGQDAIIRRFQVADGVVSTQLRNDIDSLQMILRRFGLTYSTVDLPRLLPEDELEPALEIMATVRAYFQVAFKRFIDLVPLEVDCEFVRGFERTIPHALVVGLDLKSSAKCASWLLDSPETLARRKELMATKQRLEAAQLELSSFVLV